MNRRRWRTVAGALAVLLVACAPAGTGSRHASDIRAMGLQADDTVGDSAALGLATLATTPPSEPPVETVIASPPETMEGAAASAPPPALLHSRITGTGTGTWAVVIGINDYPGASYDLRSAVNDADDVDRALAAVGVPSDRRLVLRDGQASRKTLLSSVDWLNAHAGPDAVAVFFYAGHVRKLAPGREGIVTADGNTVTDTELASRLSSLPARRAWIGIAACYGGGFTEVLRAGRVLTAAASADERAYENSAFGRSYMVEYMVRQGILEMRAPESVQAAFAYARNALARDYPNRLPVQFDYSGGQLDLRQPGFTGAAKAGAAPASGSGSGSGSGSQSAPPPSEPAPSDDGTAGSGGGNGGESTEPKKCDVTGTGLLRNKC